MKKLLALNRGEIAIRILRAATELGLRTVAIYSQEDRLALHRFKADEAYLVGAGKGPVQAYLDVDGHRRAGARKGRGRHSSRVTASCRRIPRCPRVRDGRNHVCRTAAPRLLELLGDKTAARRWRKKAGVPVVPGTEEPVSNRNRRRRSRKRSAFPLIIKAAFGGGGRGMRVVEKRRRFRWTSRRSPSRGEGRVRQ